MEAGRVHSKRKCNVNSRNDTVGSRVDAAARCGKGQGDDRAIAPCCDGGGVLDAGGVGQILARSLGNAVSVVRRNRAGGGERNEGRESANENIDGVGGGRFRSGSRHHGSCQDNGDCSTGHSPWRSWNEPPPPALLTAGEIRSLSAGKRRDDRRRQPQTPEVVAEIVPPPLFHSRRRFNNNAVGDSSTAVDGKNGARVAARAAATLSPAVGRAASPGKRTRSGGGDRGEPPSAASSSTSSSSRRTASGGGGAPLVPRVAMLATASSSFSSNPDSSAEAMRKKGKHFDPDRLECVRRHEASVAERERRVRSLRTKAEKRSMFRARPLPPFLDSSSSSDGAGKGDIGQRGSGGGGGGAARTYPELLAALEQVCDNEMQVAGRCRPD